MRRLVGDIEHYNGRAAIIHLIGNILASLAEYMLHIDDNNKPESANEEKSTFVYA